MKLRLKIREGSKIDFEMLSKRYIILPERFEDYIRSGLTEW